MFLKRLDIIGFKSFAQRVTIDFVKGVTAVVGPNGSGKSNITDAIRWVLGEQSVKSLRGAKMEDIIFAGSDGRKPLNYAEVTLTLDNEDQQLPLEYSEVSVTRRVYRSGDSDFYINKQSCRLKDIVDLFMDSGLGREAFSIISQGKVEEILSSKPEERRGIFEEAAGVLKYKNRKKKAEAKLFETQENLNRVDDILFELSSQIEPLRMQASIAKEYIEHRDELEKVEAALLVYEIESLHQKWEELKLEIAQNSDLEIALSTEISTEESKQHELQEKLNALDESIDQLQQVLLTVTKNLEKYEGQKELMKERKRNTSTQSEQLRKQVDEVTVQINETIKLIEAEKEQEKLSRQNVNKTKTNIVEIQNEITSYEGDIEEQIELIKSDYIELLNNQASIKNEKTMLEKQSQQYSVKSSRLDLENEKYIRQREQLQNRKTELLNEKEQTDLTFKELNEKFETLNKQHDETAIVLKEKEELLNKAYQFIQQTKSRKETLEELQEDFAGFNQGVKEILKARGTRLEGIKGAIAELITTNKQYEIAIEIALGAATQQIVVENDEHARRAIQFLKQQRLGRATFLPMNIVKARFVPANVIEGLKRNPSFIGVASSLVSNSGEYEQVIQNLLGTVLIAQDLKGANELAKLVGHRYRFVTLEGDVVNPGGAMTGGAVRTTNSSLIGRQRELEEITVKLKDMQEKTNSLESEVQILKATILDSSSKAQTLNDEIQNVKQIIVSIMEQLKSIEFEEKNINDALAIYDLEMGSSASDLLKVKDRLEELSSLDANVKNEIIASEQKINELTERKLNQKEIKDELQSKLTSLKIYLAQEEQKLNYSNEKIRQFEDNSIKQKQILEQTKEKIIFLSSELMTNENGKEELEKIISDTRIEFSKTTEIISKRREQRIAYQTELEDYVQSLREKQRQYKSLSDLLKQQEVNSNRLDVELENRLEQLNVKYMTTYEAAKMKYTLEMTVDDARKRVKLLKRSIEELGTVNIGAIDEYERVSERHDFLQEQRTDLNEAKITLYNVISEMDEEMTKRFETSFNAIREKFQVVFTQLFGGGRADLVLTDAENLLLTGVDIVAQPPGKKLQNLGLLSGGERALTAIALLFAILQVRPVPFCVLDEVEAALDEANVARFAKFLKYFSEQTQFIVITHRKGTMEECDVLYGVTMQEYGVSTLVSVRLDEGEVLLSNGN
ncbi:chromosome segregation protein SMC [Gottfriedia acidiceleris]|uniref:Chromosome partition protein Smc n=1 Tax=Gottfriedia acidiceleris TaxID=371036 RepID=A0ABY4JK12_9BACI|nr:chromosome segregation protein SMC [Gottfriedia acidiceleris]UPM53057.1 chromosome segregation protein SMC [Gottfriedia acidiceleris]